MWPFDRFRKPAAPAATEAPAAQQRAFAAAQLNRLTASWQITGDKIDDELRNDLDALRNRSRTLENNNDHALKYLDLVETNLIGDTAPRLVSFADDAPGKPDTMARKAILAGWAEWSARGVCEVSGQYDFTEFCQTVARGTARDGEALVLIHRGSLAGNRFGYALQVLDVDRLATWLNRAPQAGENAIVCGVEVSARGKPVAYHFNTGRNVAWARAAQRVDAETVLHRFVQKRPEQRRGVPWSHAAMLSMHFAGEFALSALMAAKHGADHLGFFTTPDGEAPGIGDEASDEAGARIATSAPGTWETLPEGVTVQSVDSKYPNEVFGAFMTTAYQRMASGLPGANYPELCNDYAAVNYGSLRGATLSSRDEWRKRQKWFATAWLTPIFADWLRSALGMAALTFPSGAALPVDKFAKFAAHGWRFRGWDWIDPAKDIKAAREAVELRVNSISRIAQARGVDIEDVFDDMQQEEALAKKYGITLPGAAAPAAGAPDMPPPPDDPKKPPSSPLP